MSTLPRQSREAQHLMHSTVAPSRIARTSSTEWIWTRRPHRSQVRIRPPPIDTGIVDAGQQITVRPPPSIAYALGYQKSTPSCFRPVALSSYIPPASIRATSFRISAGAFSA